MTAPAPATLAVGQVWANLKSGIEWTITELADDNGTTLALLKRIPRPVGRQVSEPGFIHEQWIRQAYRYVFTRQEGFAMSRSSPATAASGTERVEYRIAWPDGVTDGPFDTYEDARAFTTYFEAMGGVIEERSIVTTVTAWQSVSKR